MRNTITPPPTGLHLLDYVHTLAMKDQIAVVPIPEEGDEAFSPGDMFTFQVMLHDTEDYQHPLDYGIVNRIEGRYATLFSGAVFADLDLLDKIDLPQLQAIFLIGSSATGKTTFAHEFVSLASRMKGRGGLFLPKRAITRPTRQGDNLDENYFVPREELEAAFEDPESDLLAWKRNMEEGRSEYYGFDFPRINLEGRLPLFSGNNDLLRNPGKRLDLMLEAGNVLVIRTTTPDTIRDSRLAERSPDLKSAERAYRLRDSGGDVAEMSHINVYNHHDACEGNAFIFALFLSQAITRLIERQIILPDSARVS